MLLQPQLILRSVIEDAPNASKRCPYILWADAQPESNLRVRVVSTQQAKAYGTLNLSFGLPVLNHDGKRLLLLLCRCG